jgi:hypothetical protein
VSNKSPPKPGLRKSLCAVKKEATMIQWFADSYVEPTDLEWIQKYFFAAAKRKDQLDEEGLTITELV